MLTEANGRSLTISPWDYLQGVSEPKFLIRLTYVTPNLGYSAESAKYRVHFLGHRMGNGGETSYVGRGWWVMHDGWFFSTVKVNVKVNRVNGSEWRFRYYESTGSSPGRDGAGIFNFVPGALNLGYLTESAMGRVCFLGHGMSIGDETWYVGRIDEWFFSDGLTPDRSAPLVFHTMRQMDISSGETVPEFSNSF